MGQEIVYCYWCSGRILGADIDKGAAVLIGNHACCAECLPKVMASLPHNQRETLQAALSRSTLPARPSGRTPRATPAVSAPSARSSTLKMGIIGGSIVALALLLLWLGGRGKKDDPAPARVDPRRPEAPDREKTARDAVQKARDAGRAGVDVDQQAKLWDEALDLSEGTAIRDEAARDQAAFLDRRKQAIAQELTRLLDNVDTLIKDAEFKKALDVLSSARNRRNVPEWATAIDRKIDEVRKAEGGGPYRQGADADGIVCVEAERYHLKADIREHAWAPVTEPAGFAGASAMAALPNKGGSSLKNFMATSPRLDYRVLFTKTGPHYVWIRGHGASGADDSAHLGVDGKEVAAATGIVVGGKWSWTRRCLAAAVSKVDIETPGVHTINLWMREDGAIIDRILLTSNDKYVPKDAGPPESLR